MLNRRSNQHLRIRPRHKHSGAYVKVDIPECAAASDIGNRLSPLAPLDHRPEALRDRSVGRRENQPVTIDMQCLGHQQLDIKAGGIARLRKLTRCTSERAVDWL